MSIVRRFEKGPKKGRARTIRCDGCGRLSSDADSGSYFDRKTGKWGSISSNGRCCEHDYCDDCEAKLAPDYVCPKCGDKPSNYYGKEDS